MSHPFALGWNPDRSEAARAALLASRRYCTVAPNQKTPPAWSLSGKRLRDLKQFQAGTCWVHSVAQLIETSANALGYPAFPASRLLLGLVGKAIEGGGNPTDGGDPTDAILAATAEKGAGVAHESLCPYPVTADMSPRQARRALAAASPTQAALADAKACHLTLPVVVASDADAKALIFGGHGCCNGMWWPFGFDDPKTFMDSLGAGAYGHSLYEMGYCEAGVLPGAYGQSDWWQLDNWHGRLYPPLPPECAERIPGYQPITPTATSDFWVKGDVYRAIKSMGSFVHVSAVDLAGLARNVVVPGPDLTDLTLV